MAIYSQQIIKPSNLDLFFLISHWQICQNRKFTLKTHAQSAKVSQNLREAKRTFGHTIKKKKKNGEKNLTRVVFFCLPLPSPLNLQVGRSPRCHRGTWEMCPYSSSATEEEKSKKQK